jgi:hypothetical protein
MRTFIGGELPLGVRVGGDRRQAVAERRSPMDVALSGLAALFALVLAVVRVVLVTTALTGLELPATTRGERDTGEEKTTCDDADQNQTENSIH